MTVLVRTAALLVLAGLGLGLIGSVAGIPGILAQDKKGDKDKDKDKEKDKKIPDKKKELPKDKTPPVQELKGDKDGKAWIVSLATNADGKYLLTANKAYKDYTVQVWDLKAGKAVTTIKDNPTEVRAALFTADGKHVITTTGKWDKKKDKKDKKDEKFEGEIRLYDVKTGKLDRSFKGHSSFIRCAALSGDGKLLVTGSEDNTAIIWDLKEGKALQTLKGSKTLIKSVGFNKDATQVIVGSAELPPKDPGKKPKPGEKVPEPEPVVRVYNVADGKEAQVLKGPERDASSVAFSPDGKFIAAGSLDGKIYLWEKDGKLGKKLEAQEGVLSISFSHDSKYLAASGYDDTTKVWDVESGKDLFYRNGHKNSVLHVLFSNDDQRFFTAGMDTTVKVWEMPKK